MAATRIKYSFLRTRRGQELISKAFSYFCLTVGAIMVSIPLVWMLSTGLKGPAETFAFPPTFIPKNPNWGNFVTALTMMPFHIFFKNTMIIVVACVLGQVFANIVVGYSFARLRFRGRHILFMIMLATMMVPGQVTMIPLFITFTKLGWVNTFLPLIVPNFFANPFFVFLVRQFMLTIPYEYDEAARLDGCNTWQILYKIIVPMSKPVITLIIVFTFLWTWGDFMGPLIYLNDESKYTLALGLALFKGRFFTHWNYMMAASLVVSLPVLVVYFFAQNYIIGGISALGLKN